MMFSWLRSLAILSVFVLFQSCGKNDDTAPTTLAQLPSAPGAATVKEGDEIRGRVTLFVLGKQVAQYEVLNRVLDVQGDSVQILTRKIPYARRGAAIEPDRIRWKDVRSIPSLRTDIPLEAQCASYETGGVADWAVVVAGRFASCKVTRRSQMNNEGSGVMGTSYVWFSHVPFSVVREEWRSDDGKRSRVFEMLSYRRE